MELRYLGILSERNYTRQVVSLLNKSSKQLPVREIMRTDLPKLSKNDPIEKCMEIMTQLNVRYLPVVENETLIGLISVKDLLDEVLLHQKRCHRKSYPLYQHLNFSTELIPFLLPKSIGSFLWSEISKFYYIWENQNTSRNEIHHIRKNSAKRHTILNPRKGISITNSFFGTEGFHGISSLLYHIHRPTQIKSIGTPKDVTPKLQ